MNALCTALPIRYREFTRLRPSLFHELLASAGAGATMLAALAPADGPAPAPPNTKSWPLAAHTPYPAELEVKSLGVAERAPRSPPGPTRPTSTALAALPAASMPAPRYT